MDTLLRRHFTYYTVLLLLRHVAYSHFAYVIVKNSPPGILMAVVPTVITLFLLYMYNYITAQTM